MRRSLPIVALLFALVLPTGAFAQDDPPAAEPPNLLVWTGTYGFRHPSITYAQLAFQELAATGVFTVTITENPQELTAANLANYDALVWVSTTGKPPLMEQQRTDIIRYAACGGGNVGFHAAADSNYGWAEHAELFGAQFDSHPHGFDAPAATMIVEDHESPITEGWHGVDSFPLQDEYYRWRGAKGVPGVSLPRNFGDVHVLLSLDETTVAEGIQDGPLAYEHHQPIAWTKTFRDRGRVYYNNMGHSEGTWGVPEFRTSIVNGVTWVTGVPLDLECFNGDTELPPGPSAPPANPATVGIPCVVPDLGERSGGTWETSGPARALTAVGDEQAVSAGIAGGFGWGAQTWYLDLSDVGAASAEVTLTLNIPNPADDYDLGVTTAWGWYGAHQMNGAATEQIIIPNVPHCSYLHVTADNAFGTGAAAPTIVATVSPSAEGALTPGVTRIPSATPGAADVAVGWSSERTAPGGAPACACALIARDDDFADALASGAAQAASGAVLLLTNPDSLTQATADELTRLGITSVTVLGGPAAVAEDVLTAISALGITVDRVFGPTRIDTAIEVARRFPNRGGGVPLVLRAFGSDSDSSAGFADSLAAGREAVRANRPILLTDSGALSPQVQAYLQEIAATEAVILGGTAAVGQPVEDALTGLGVTVTRVAGDTRAATAVAIATQLFGFADAGSSNGVLLLDGNDPVAWADGFAGAAAPFPGPIILSNGDTLPAETATWLGTGGDGSVPLACGALVDTAACDAAAAALGYPA